MSDETATTTPPETDAANPDAPPAEEKKKIKQIVDIKDIGPCKKHIKVTVLREDIDASFQKKFKELVGGGQVHSLGLPHARGGEPAEARMYKAVYRSSPRTWG